MYRKRFVVDLTKKPNTVPLKSSEKSISLPIHNENYCENLNLINHNSPPIIHASLPVRKNDNTNLLNRLSQDSKTYNASFIKPQQVVEKAREIINVTENINFKQNGKKFEISQNLNTTSQQNHSEHEEKSKYNSMSKPIEEKNIIKAEVKSKNFNKEKQNPIQHKEKFKINTVPNPVEVKNIIKTENKSRNVNKKQQNSNQHEEKPKINILQKNWEIKPDTKCMKIDNKHETKYSKVIEKDLLGSTKTTKRSQKTLLNLKNAEDDKKLIIKRIPSKVQKHQTGEDEEKNETNENETFNLSQKSFQLTALLSQPSKNLSHRKRLEWLRDRRGVGTWIQCCKNDCSKWRYEPNIKDPIDVPEQWFCFMNSDGLANCNEPESPPSITVEEDLIHNMYTAGSLVWAHLRGYPWWPAMVDDCPDTEQYYWLNEFSDIPTSYHVVFFEENTVSRSWIKLKDLQPFKTGKEKVRTRVGKQDYKDRIKIAKIQALEALQFDIPKRLYKYGFLSRWTGPINTPPSPDSDDSVDENDSLCDLDTLVNLSNDLSFSSHNDSFTLSVQREFKKNRKRKILDDDSLSESKAQNISKTSKEQSKSDSLIIESNNDEVESKIPNGETAVLKPSNIDSVNTESNDLILNNTQITNDLFKDIANNRENEVSSTVSLFHDIASLHSSNMFNSDEENITPD